MPVIHASDVSEEAALISVMDAPTLPGAATTRLGNSVTAASATRHKAAADCRRNATRSLPLRPSAIDAITHARNTRAMTTPAASMPGANTGFTTANARTVATANSTRAATWQGTRSFAARLCTAEPAGAFNATHAAPAERHMVRPSRPATRVNGESRPRSGTPV